MDVWQLLSIFGVFGTVATFYGVWYAVRSARKSSEAAATHARILARAQEEARRNPDQIELFNYDPETGAPIGNRFQRSATATVRTKSSATASVTPSAREEQEERILPPD